MNWKRDQLTQLLRESNPFQVASPHVLDDLDRARIERIVQEEPDDELQPQRPPWGKRAFRVAVVAGAVASVVVAVQLGALDGDETAALAETPEQLNVAHQPIARGATDQLLRIADRVEDLPNDVGVRGDIRVRTEQWSLFTRVDGEQVDSEVVPQSNSTEITPTGARTTTTAYEYNGRERRETSSTDGQPVESMDDSPRELSDQFASSNPVGPRGRFNAIVEAHLETPAPPESRAAVLRYLAATDTIKSVGRLTDRLGRPGVGFTIESDASGLPTRYMLIVDPRNGHLIGYEETLTEDPGKLNVTVPSVIQYIAWEEARYSK